ncbi:MAG: hypothetical protein JWL83_4846, partial [Actinomycetia bacterium]|nr:hypothetical protein [Actinomycetes bacterium]
AWTEPDDATRLDLIGQVWAAEGKLADPPMTADGHTELSAITGTLQTQFPGHTFRRTTTIDAHHGFLRYGWALVAADGTTALTGTDIAVVGEDGKLQRVVGFFGELAAA